MGNKWILDVLADLQTFAAQNGLPDLAGRLEETATLADREIMSLGGEVRSFVRLGDGLNAGRISSEVGASSGF